MATEETFAPWIDLNAPGTRLRPEMPLRPVGQWSFTLHPDGTATMEDARGRWRLSAPAARHAALQMRGGLWSAWRRPWTVYGPARVVPQIDIAPPDPED